MKPKKPKQEPWKNYFASLVKKDISLHQERRKKLAA